MNSSFMVDFGINERNYYGDKLTQFAITTPLSIVGIIGNILTIHVLSRCHHTSPVPLLLLHMGIQDLLNLITTLLEVSVRFFFASLPVGIVLVSSMFRIHMSQISYGTLFILSIERLISVTRPLTALSGFSRRRTHILLALLYLFHVFLVIVTCLLAYVPFSSMDHEAVSTMMETLSYFLSFIPIFGSLVCNIVIIVQLRRRKRRFSQITDMQKKSQEDNFFQVTRIILINSFICIVLTLLVLMLPLYKYLCLDSVINVNLLTYTTMLNHVVNPIVYVAVPSSYRSEFRRALCCKCCLEDL